MDKDIKFVSSMPEFERNAAAKARMEANARRIARQRKAKQMYIIVAGLIFLIASVWVVLSISAEPIRAVPPPTAAPEVIPTVKAAPVPTAPPARYPLTSAQRNILAAIAYTEARGDGMTGMSAALMVVRNRIDDGRFGDTIEEICTPGQFHGLQLYDISKVTADAYRAVEAVFDLEQADMTQGALYFCTGSPDTIKAGLVETVIIGGHHFYTDKT